MIARQNRNKAFVIVAGLVFVVLVLVLANAGIFGTTQASLDQRLLAISSQLHAPGDTTTQTVASSNVPAAWTIRRQIVAMLDKGMSDQAILQTLTNEYGPSVLATPPWYGFGLWVWVIPVVGLAAALGAGIILTRQRSRKGLVNTTETVPEDIEDKTDELEETLRQYL